MAEQVKTPKTYKREVAASLLVFWCVVCVWATEHPGSLEVLKIVTAPIWLFTSLAYGMDSAAKQFGVGRWENEQ